jgi:enoyl-CoA hydratase
MTTMLNVTQDQSYSDITEKWSIPSHLTNQNPIYQTLIYHVSPPLAFITFNRSEKLNTISPLMPSELQHAINRANYDDSVRVIILRSNGTSFCAGFDFGADLTDFPSKLGNSMESWDPGADMMFTTSKFTGPVAKFMSIWYSSKPVIAQIHGYCVGGGSDMALCADIIIAAADAIIGTPYSRVWGAYLTGM